MKTLKKELTNLKRITKNELVKHKKAAQNLLELAGLFSNMKKENDKSQNYEDMDVLRQILENLGLFFS